MQEPTREPEDRYRDERVYSDAAAREDAPMRERRVYGTENTPTTVDRGATPRVATGLSAAFDSVRWGPILAGFFVAILVQSLLFLLGLGFGLSTNVSRTTGGAVPNLTVGLAIWGLITTVISFFIGGWVAGRTAAVGGALAGVLNGLVVFALSLVFGMILSGLGATAFFGSLGVPGAAATGGNLGTLTNAVWWFFFWLVVGAVAAAIGGWVGGMYGTSRLLRR